MPTAGSRAAAGPPIDTGSPVDQHLAGGAAQHAEQRQQQLALALAVEPAEPDHLARPHRERDVGAAARPR